MNEHVPEYNLPPLRGDEVLPAEVRRRLLDAFLDSLIARVDRQLAAERAETGRAAHAEPSAASEVTGSASDPPPG